MPFCTNCGLKLRYAIQKFCNRCGHELKIKNENNISIPIISTVPNDIPLQDQKLFEIMAKDFVPVEYSKTYLLIPPNEQVFSSLLATIALKIRTGYLPGPGFSPNHQWIHFTTHVLITKSGIVFKFTKDLSGLAYKLTHGQINLELTPLFYYWNDPRLIPRGGKIKIGNIRVYIAGDLIKKEKKYSGVYSKDVYLLLKRNFFPFCKLLRNNFFAFIEELKRCVNNIDLLKQYMNRYSIEEYIDKLNTFHNAGLWREAGIILDNTFNYINNEEKKKFLNLIRNFAEFSKYNEYYEIALKYNNIILELNPSNTNALKNKKSIQETLNHKSIPIKVRMKAVKLCKKGLKLCEKDQLEEGLELIKRSHEISPNDSRIKEELVAVLRKLGRDDEIKNYFEA